MVDSITVNLGARSYPIYFGSNLDTLLSAHISSLLASGRRVAVITDEHVQLKQKAFIDLVFKGLPRLVLVAGEKAKSLAGLEQCLDFLSLNTLGRDGVVIACGGGVIGDLAGFAAASYLRGVDFIQIPTTLLAMVDSSVGGKTGINLSAGKNLAGAFYQPKAVYISNHFLTSLPPREFAAGMAEVIKYGLLSDASLLKQLEHAVLTPESSHLSEIIKSCCKNKAVIVEHDERELAEHGGRALLNLGHTFAHAIENVSGYGTYLHGEAVAIGLCAAARLSLALGYITEQDVARVDAVVKAHGLPSRLSAPLSLKSLMQATTKDKKSKVGILRFIVLKALGTAQIQSGVDPSLAEAAFREIGAL